MKNKLKNQMKGFTIIEVMIVLTIAGLILLIVFLAVPALERSSRNTQRKNDVAAILAATSDYVSNNQGQLPTSSGAFNTVFVNSNAKLGFYQAASVNYVYSTTAYVSAPTPPALTTNDTVVVYNYLLCNGNVPTITNASARSIIALYNIEGSGSNVAQCQQG